MDSIQHVLFGMWVLIPQYTISLTRGVEIAIQYEVQQSVYTITGFMGCHLFVSLRERRDI